LVLESEKIVADGQAFNDWIEPQNFRPPHETELIFSQYGREEIFTAEVFGLNLIDGTIINYSKTPKQYDEPKGFFQTANIHLLNQMLTIHKVCRLLIFICLNSTAQVKIPASDLFQPTTRSYFILPGYQR
jgi:hypothetical protein